MYHFTPKTTSRCCDSVKTGKRWTGFRKFQRYMALVGAVLLCALSANAQISVIDTDTTLLAPPAPSSAVNVCTTSVVVAGFGIDGDMYANTTVVGSDDWFQGVLAGDGVGVIGEGAATSDRNLSGAAFKAYLQAAASVVDRNRTYVQRMAQPFPWLVPANAPEYILLDAVGARDNFASGNALDTTTFSGQSNKNGDSPYSWTIGVGGSPQKNDLIDVGGHIRRDLSDNSLWGYAFASTLSTDGNSHTDFEVFRTAPIFNPLTNTITNTGPAATGGHTAGLFWGPGVDAGKVRAPGDLLVAIDYENGGAAAFASVRIWIKPSDVTGTGQDTAWLNSQPNRPFTFTGVFDSGNGANGYGYAEIRPKVVDPNNCLIFSVQNSAITKATPWGTIEGSQATYEDDYIVRQMMEVGINFSAFGLDIDPVSGPCFNLFGSLLVKTRSSSSFTAELKDYSGPYVFGNFAEVQANAGPDKSVNCGQTSVRLEGSSPTVTVLGGQFVWTTYNGGQILQDANTLTPLVTAGCYILTVNHPSFGTCVAIDTVCVNAQNTPPGLQCGPGANLTCTTTSAQICASTSQPSTYVWSTGATTACITVTSAGTYTVTATNSASGCTETCSIVVTADNTPPGLQCGPGANLTCTTTSAQICASTSAASTYLWSTGATSACITVTQPGTYTVTATNSTSGCTQSCSIVVTQDLTPPGLQCGPGANLTCTTTSAQICASTSATSTYLWSTGATTDCITVTQPGTYTVTATNSASGCTQSCSIVVTQDLTPPGLQCGPGANLTCTTTSAQICASTTAASTYLWSTGATSACITVTGPGTYTVTATNNASGCTQSCSIVVTQDLTPPGLQCGPGAHLTCTTTSAQICASTSAASTYLWSTGATTDCITVTGPGTYTVTATNNASGCTQSCSIVVTQDVAGPGLQCGPGAHLTCTTTSAQICASTSQPSTYLWSTGATSACITVTQPGTYTVTATNTASGCTASCSIVVTQDLTPPGLQCGPGAHLTCTTTSAQICASTSAASTYLWSTGATTDCITVTGPGTYTVTATNNASGCTQSCSIVVTQDLTPPGLQCGPGAHLTCANPSAQICASTSAASTYLWSTGATTDCITVTQPGTYTVTATNNASGCTQSCSIVVTQDIAGPGLQCGPGAHLTCTTTSAQICASTSQPSTYLWSTGATSACITVTQPGTYTVTATNTASGCTASCSIVVTQDLTPPGLQCGPGAHLTCTTTSAQICASTSAASTYLWSTGATSACITVTGPGTYTVTATNNASGCTQSCSIVVTQDLTPPGLQCGPGAHLTCTTTSAQICASTSAASTYLWSTGATTDCITVTQPGTYTVTATNNASGCTQSCSIVVTQDIAGPGLQCGPGAHLTCTTTSAQICASTTTASTYLWSTGATTDCITVTGPGTYTVTATNTASGCTASCSIVVTQDLTPPGLQCGPGANLTCATTSAQICASTSAASTYLWSTGATSACITVTQPGTYTVTATNNASGCTQSCSIVVTQDLTPPGLQCGPGANLTCTTTSAQICASTSAASTYLWSTGATSACITVTQPGTYTVTATNNATGCTQSCSIVVTQDLTPPGLQCGPGANLTCTTTSAQICASTSAASTYLWSTGATSACITVTQPGTYTVTATNNASGCTQSCSIVVTQDLTPPGLQCGPGATITCANPTRQICASTSAPSTYLWSTGATTDCITVSLAGTYTVTATNNASGCTQSCSIVVGIDTVRPNVNAGADIKLTCTYPCKNLTATSSTQGVTFLWSTGATSATINVCAAGNYTVTATGPNGCTKSDVVCVRMDTIKPSLTAPNTVLNCYYPCRTITASSSTPNVTYLWSTGATTASIEVCQAGNYTVTVTNPVNGCTRSKVVCVTANFGQPNISAGADVTINCTYPCRNLTATSSTAGATFLWSTGATTATINVCAAGNYVVTATNPNTGCTKSDTVCVKQNFTTPHCSLTAPVGSIFCGSTGNTITKVVANATNYQWKFIGNSTWVITAGATSSTMTYTAGTGPVTLRLIVSNSTSGCKDSCEVTLNCTTQRFCTYTQGGYGNPNGMRCNGQRTTDFVATLLSSGPLVIGSTANNRSITFGTGDALCLIGRLPSGGPSVMLNSGNNTCASPNQPLGSGGRFTNTLLGQTITLGLNMRIPGSTLSSLVVTGQYMITYSGTGTGCSGAGTASGTGSTVLLSSKVLNYLGGNPTVQQIYDLANRALGGTYVPANSSQPSLSEINNTVAKFNEGFDNCRLIGGFTNVAPLAATARMEEPALESYNSGIYNTAYPNPFNSTTAIEFMMEEYQSAVTVDVYDMAGHRVAALYSGEMNAGVKMKVEFNALDLPSGIYMYRIIAGDHMVNEKLMLVK